MRGDQQPGDDAKQASLALSVKVSVPFLSFPWLGLRKIMRSSSLLQQGTAPSFRVFRAYSLADIGASIDLEILSS